MAKDVLCYDPEADDWQHITDLPKKSAQCVAEIVDNKLFVIAGDTGCTTGNRVSIAPATCRGDVQDLRYQIGAWSGRDQETDA